MMCPAPLQKPIDRDGPIPADSLRRMTGGDTRDHRGRYHALTDAQQRDRKRNRQSGRGRHGGSVERLGERSRSP